jgi:hypothetical protein
MENWWKDIARTYGKVTAEVRAMTDEEFAEYRDKWRLKAVSKLGGLPSAETAKWVGFWHAVVDDEKRREHSRALTPGKAIESDAWLDGVLTYLYEDKEVPKPLEG